MALVDDRIELYGTKKFHASLPLSRDNLSANLCWGYAKPALKIKIHGDCADLDRGIVLADVRSLATTLRLERRSDSCMLCRLRFRIPNMGKFWRSVSFAKSARINRLVGL